MATRAETEKAEAVKKGPRPKRAKKLAQRKPHVHHPAKRAAKKATYAEETVAPGTRPSRKSSRRASAADIKHDTQEARHRQRKVRSPKTRAEKTQARNVHPRASR